MTSPGRWPLSTVSAVLLRTMRAVRVRIQQYSHREAGKRLFHSLVTLALLNPARVELVAEHPHPIPLFFKAAR